jgi:hypothetical protein
MSSCREARRRASVLVPEPIEPMRQAGMDDVTVVDEARFRHDPLRGPVRGQRPGDDALEPEALEGESRDGTCRFARQPLSPVSRRQRVEQLDLAAAVDRHPPQADVADQGALLLPAQDPQPAAGPLPVLEASARGTPPGAGVRDPPSGSRRARGHRARGQPAGHGAAPGGSRSRPSADGRRPAWGVFVVAEPAHVPSRSPATYPGIGRPGGGVGRRRFGVSRKCASCLEPFDHPASNFLQGTTATRRRRR